MPNVPSETVNDASRLRALAALNLIDTPPEAEFDALAALAAKLLDCPIGMVTLVERDWQSFKAVSGADFTRVARQHSFCNHAIGEGHPLIVVDATRDPRFLANPLVTDRPSIRAYAGAPISAEDPQTGKPVAVGAVCAIDFAPRSFSAEQEAMLAHLQALAEALFAARALQHRAEQQSHALQRKDRSFRQAERMAQIGSWRLELDSERVEWSEGIFRIHELDPSGAPPLQDALSFYPPHARAQVSGAMAATIETGTPFDFETDFVTARGRQRRVRSMGEIELRDGRPAALIGMFQDITDQYAIEQSLRRSATIDELTRIANRAAYNTRLEVELAAARADGTPLALLLVDIDRFKSVNDEHGHLAGDDVLRAFGRRLRRAAPANGFAARIGGDEFALILNGEAATRVEAVAEALLEEMRVPVPIGGRAVPTSGTIGYTTLRADVATVRELAHRADSALYRAKRECRGTAQGWEAQRGRNRSAS